MDYLILNKIKIIHLNHCNKNQQHFNLVIEEKDFIAHSIHLKQQMNPSLMAKNYNQLCYFLFLNYHFRFRIFINQMLRNIDLDLL